MYELIHYNSYVKIELDSTTTHLNRINSYEQGSILVGNKRFVSSFIITPSILIHNWPPQIFADIAPHHLDQVLEMKPELILLGTGRRQHFPETDLFLNTKKLNVGFEVMDTGAACRSYNILLQEGRNVAAALLMIE
ncbi:MAG: Mth938-like domain-containing protein [Proteobacteria bacterium]|nr:Mth938-like domain-containing protein [Pseudomonadota bacterium]